MISTLAVSLLMVAECQVVLRVNNEEIRRLDPLLVNVVVTNRGLDSAVILRKSPHSGSQCHATYELRTPNGWRSVPGMHHEEDCSVYLPMRNSVPTAGPTLEPKASYAEFETLFLEADEFVFGAAGIVHLRAVVETSEGTIVSRPVKVVVRERSDAQVQRIQKARERRVLGMIGTDWLSSDLSADLKSLKGLDGNIGQSVRNLILLEHVIQGRKEIGDENAAEFLKQHMKGVDWELGLLVLGTHYRKQNDLKRLTEVVEAMPQLTYRSHPWASHLELLTPPSFVPGRRSPPGRE